MCKFFIDIDKLITLVKERPVLWDKTLDIYKDRNKTREAWREICLEFDEEFESKPSIERKHFGQQVIKKWTNIRDSWMRACRKEIACKKSGLPATKSRKYIYYDEMSFLKKINFNRQTDSTLDWQEENVSQTDTKNQQHQQLRNQDKVHKGTDQVDQTAHKSNKSLRRNKGTSKPTTSSELSTVQSSNNTGGRKRKLDEFKFRMQKAVKQVESEEANLNFFKGILPSLKNFSSDQIIDFQMGVLQLIKTIRSQNAVPPLNTIQEDSNISPFKNYISQITPFNYHLYSHTSETNRNSTQQSNSFHQYHQNSTLQSLSISPNDSSSSSNSNSRLTTLSSPSPSDTNFSCISVKSEIDF